MPVGRARAGKTSKTRPIFRTLTFCLVKRKKKTLHLQVFSGRGKAGNEKVTVNSKYYHDGVKIKFFYSWIGKQLHLLEKVSGIKRALQTPMIVLLTKIFTKVNWKQLTILAKWLILDAWLGPGRASADWYSAVFKIQMKRCLDGRQVEIKSF